MTVPEPVVPVDTVGAFVGAPALLAHGAAEGPLAGTTVAVKDLFDVAGTVTGGGNPDFAAGREPATAHAAAVAALVAAGASVVGKTVTDELAYSLAGTNVHFGTPTNVAAPGRVPGGSSAGSAAAVAAGLVDLGLGTDTGGSIRVPASYCGLWGWRPTHGAVSLDGALPLGPTFDTAGLFARDPRLLATAAEVLLTTGEPVDTDADGRPPRLVLGAEALAEVAPDLADGLRSIATDLDPAARTLDLDVDLEEAAAAFRALQGAQAWRAHGPWITATSPRFGPGIAARFAAASRVTPAEEAAAAEVRVRVRRAVERATAAGGVLVLPAAAGPAPPPVTDPASHDLQRARTLRLTGLAGLAGAPVVVAPLLRAEGLPFGVAFVGAPGTDRRLLRWLAELTPGAGRT